MTNNQTPFQQELAEASDNVMVAHHLFLSAMGFEAVKLAAKESIEAKAKLEKLIGRAVDANEVLKQQRSGHEAERQAFHQFLENKENL